VGFLDSLLGRTRLPLSNEDRLFAMSTAAITLETAGDLHWFGRAAIVFKQLPPGRFRQVRDDAVAMVRQEARSEDDLLGPGALPAVASGPGAPLPSAPGPAAGLSVDEHTDELGFDWLVVGGEDLQAVLAALHGIAQSLLEEGLGDALLAAVFRFQQSSQPVYWVYGYKQATFYPFIPSGPHQRDNAAELRLSALAKGELPVEPQVERWFALWGAPI